MALKQQQEAFGRGLEYIKIAPVIYYNREPSTADDTTTKDTVVSSNIMTKGVPFFNQAGQVKKMLILDFGLSIPHWLTMWRVQRSARNEAQEEPKFLFGQRFD